MGYPTSFYLCVQVGDLLDVTVMGVTAEGNILLRTSSGMTLTMWRGDISREQQVTQEKVEAALQCGDHIKVCMVLYYVPAFICFRR